MTKREVLQYLADHIPALESLGIKTFRQLEELIQERENEGFQLPRVSPVPPPERPVRVIHGGHSVKVPKPVVVVDSREQDGFAYTFARFPKWFAGVERAKLEAGDYSIKGMEHRLAIERKTLADLVNSAISDRQRFLGQCRCLGSRDRKVIVIEAGLAQIKSQHPESEAHPNAVVGTLVALQERWGIQVVWCDNAELAEETTAHILSKHYTLQWLADNKFPRHFVDGDV
jgi:ERCC4-type nuclease